MADLYRKSALDRISSPDQLDKALTVTSPLSWVALIGLTLAVAAVVIWSILGTIPVTVTTQGIVSSPVSTNAVYTQESGTVVTVLTRVGAELHFNDPILTYKTGGDEVKTIYADQTGTVSDLMAANGDVITQGNEVIRVSPRVEGKQAVVCYIPLAQAKQLERGMRVLVYLASADSQTYGHMEARVINIDAYAASNTGMSKVLGTDNNLVAAFQANGAVVAVTCELYPDTQTRSGYYWSNEKGKQMTVSNGSMVSAKVITEEVAPISKLFSKLKEIWGS